MAEITLEEATAIAERLEKANAEHALLLAREERLRASEILNGRSVAGQETVIDKEKEKRDRINEMLRGTGKQI
jgi:hypothetical protein